MVTTRARSLATKVKPILSGTVPKNDKLAKNMTKSSATKKKAKQTSLGFAKEKSLRNKGFQRICGVDEAGRGPWAGPVVAACCIVPIGIQLDGVIDSKQTTEEDRLRLFEQLTTNPDIEFGISIQSHKVVDDINVLQAAMLAMSESINNLKEYPDAILVDGPRLPSQLVDGVYSEAIVKGDSKVFSIAAASIIAKVTRDKIMVEYGKQYPEYLFERHKGYGTAAHTAALSKHGPTPIHRMTYKPLHRFLPPEQRPVVIVKNQRKRATASSKRKVKSSSVNQIAKDSKVEPIGEGVTNQIVAKRRRSAVTIQVTGSQEMSIGHGGKKVMTRRTKRPRGATVLSSERVVNLKPTKKHLKKAKQPHAISEE